MSERRQMRLTAFMRPVSLHTAAWRYPGAWPDANFNLGHIIRLAQKLEVGKIDGFFMADHLAVLNMPMDALKRSATPTSFEPFTLLGALAMMTKHLGLMATGSTTYDEPYHVARRFASLDHLSGGRAAWNIVTTANPDASKNFGYDTQMDHDERYVRAREFYDVVTGLWDSFADDAFVRDVEHGTYFDPAKMHALNHRGKYFNVRGPLNIARPVQGWPVIVQAGSSNAGRQLAAETAEAIFTAMRDIDEGREFTGDIRARAERAGRNPDHIKVLPGCMIYVGDSRDEAEAKRAKLDSLVHYDSGLAALSIALGLDARTLDPDAKLAELTIPAIERLAVRPRPHDGAGQAREHDRPPGGPAARRPWRARLPRNAQNDRRPDGGVVRKPGHRRVHPAVSLSARGAERRGRPRHSGTAAPRPVPQGICRPDPARESRPAAPGEPLLRRGRARGGVGRTKRAAVGPPFVVPVGVPLSFRAEAPHPAGAIAGAGGGRP